MDNNFEIGKTLWLRFLRGAISGAVSSMAVLQLSGAHSFSDVASLTYSLGVAGLMGAITGGILALDKYIRTGSSTK